MSESGSSTTHERRFTSRVRSPAPRSRPALGHCLSCRDQRSDPESPSLESGCGDRYETPAGMNCVAGGWGLFQVGGRSSARIPSKVSSLPRDTAAASSSGGLRLASNLWASARSK